MPAEIADKDYTSRRGELSAYGRATNSAKSLRRLIVVVACLCAIVLIAAFLFSNLAGVQAAVVVAIGVLGVGLIAIWGYTKTHFIDPDLAFRKWLQQVCDGEFDASIGLPQSHRHFKELDFHTGNLTTSLRRLSTDMEDLVDSQTRRLATQNQVLELLFELTSDVAGELEYQSVLSTVCTHLSSWLEDADTAAYMVENGALKLRAASGSGAASLPVTRPVTDLPAAADYESAKNQFTKLPGNADGNGQILQVPILKNKAVVGMVEIVTDSPVASKPQESQRVLQTVSELLSVNLLKESALATAHHARLVKDRTELGAELHDSLAQTLLATGYQVKLLADTQEKNSQAAVALKRIDEMINEANAEVRSLIGEYRKPLSEYRHAESIRKLIDDFNRSHDIEVFFQLDNPRILFSVREDTVIQRIIGEALNNARKYSGATMIRVYVRDEASGARSILIEDDGCGFDTDNLNSPDGADSEHIGLSIMRDRALSIAAILTIESETDEGTRVSLKLPPLEPAENKSTDEGRSMTGDI